MNKQELVASVAEESGLTKKDVEKVINALVDSVTEALKAGDKVALVGFGTFEVRTRAARSGRNPQTGDAIAIPAGKVPAFRPGKELKESV
ncbi:MAG TPA: HU family DNA-binding protein [Symbiobacteriaceae bacterium]